VGDDKGCSIHCKPDWLGEQPLAAWSRSQVGPETWQWLLEGGEKAQELLQYPQQLKNLIA